MFIFFVVMIWLEKKFRNQYVNTVFFGLLLLYAILKFRYMYAQDKENNTKTVQKALLIMLIMACVSILYYFLSTNVFYPKPF